MEVVPPEFSNLCHVDKDVYREYTVLYAAYINGFVSGSVGVDFQNRWFRGVGSTSDFRQVQFGSADVAGVCGGKVGDAGEVRSGDEGLNGFSGGSERQGFGLSGDIKKRVNESGGCCGDGSNGDGEVVGVVSGISCDGREEKLVKESVSVGEDKSSEPLAWRGGKGKLPRGPNFEKNEAKRKARKELKRSGVPLALSQSWIDRKNAENLLATERAFRDLEYQKKRDVDAEVKKTRLRILKETEVNKVAVEKAFATLKVTGNVAGYCETVVSGGPGLTSGSSADCSISPNSSVSDKEVWALQKENEDLRAEVKRMKQVNAFNNMERVALTANSDGDINESLKEAFMAGQPDFVSVEYTDDYDCFAEGKEKATVVYAKKEYCGDVFDGAGEMGNW